MESPWEDMHSVLLLVRGSLCSSSDWQPQAEPVRRVLFATRSQRFEAIREEVTSQTIARALNKLSCALARSREQRQVSVPVCLLGRLTKLVQPPTLF